MRWPLAMAAVLLLPAGLRADVRCPTGNSFGSIAFSQKSGKAGKASNYCTRSAADRKAVADCGKDDCAVQVWLDNNCGALAAARGQWAYAVGEAQDDTEALAVQQCNAKLDPPVAAAAAPEGVKALASSKVTRKKTKASPKPTRCQVVASLCSRSGQ